MNIEYVFEQKRENDAVELYKALEWYRLSGYTDEDIQKANESFCSVYAYDGDTLVGLGRVASDGLIAAIMSGICVRNDYRRHGIGAEIVRHLVEYCQSGIYKLNVQLFCEDSLIKWYENMGFERMPVGMRKPMPMNEEHSALKKNFGEIYGIEQLTELSEDFYWYNFNAFGDFSFYSGIGSEGSKVPFINMTLYCSYPVKFSAQLIFENVSEFEIGCTGVRTPLFGFDIICTERYGYSEKKRYKIRSLEDDDISFFCETFRIMNVVTSADEIGRRSSLLNSGIAPVTFHESEEENTAVYEPKHLEDESDSSYEYTAEYSEDTYTYDDDEAYTEGEAYKTAAPAYEELSYEQPTDEQGYNFEKEVKLRELLSAAAGMDDLLKALGITPGEDNQ